MTTITRDLAKVLATIRRDGDFYATGATEIATPNLKVDGVGRISLPLLPVQVKQLIAIATRSPFGRGADTLIDTRVRNSWQIQADQVHLSGRSWPATLDAIVAKAAAGLGVTEPVSAELYKLLIYEKGSFFVEHRDTEKSAGMFATLVLVLPSECSGGELIIRHMDREVCLDLNYPDPADASFAAFYADCVHEVRPVTSGYRLTLIYNLVRKNSKTAPTFPDYGPESATITSLLRHWVVSKQSTKNDSPEKLIYPLEHAYTSAELAFDALKNADAAAARVLVTAAAATDCDLHLALVEIEEEGSAEPVYEQHGRGRWHHGYDDDTENFEVGEVFDRGLTVSHWCAPDGAQPAINALPFVENELCPPEAFEDLEPDEEHFQEATGNEGASFERTYRRAALVLWPRARKLAVLHQAGLTATLPYLADLARSWKQSGDSKESDRWRDAHALSTHMLADWPASDHYRGPVQADNTTSMLSSLAQLDDTAHIDAFLTKVASTGTYSGSENEALVSAAALLAPATAAMRMEQIIARNAHMAPGACANLLARVTANVAFATTHLQPAATALVEILLSKRVNKAPPDPWQRPTPIEPSLVDDLVTALSRMDAAPLADRMVAHMLAHPETFDMDTILVPAVLGMTERAQTRDVESVSSLRKACLDHLRTRIAQPLAPPADFARPSAIACTCQYCTELARFLADPALGEWAFRAAETHRRHVETSIRQANCDLDMTTLRKGSPHSLVTTKNQASYKRRVVQRKNDLANRARLELTV